MAWHLKQLRRSRTIQSESCAIASATSRVQGAGLLFKARGRDRLADSGGGRSRRRPRRGGRRAAGKWGNKVKRRSIERTRERPTVSRSSSYDFSSIDKGGRGRSDARWLEAGEWSTGVLGMRAGN